MAKDHYFNDIYPDVKWTVFTVLGSLGLLTIVLFLCAKGEKKKKDKKTEQTNGTSNSSNTRQGSTKDVHIDIVPQFEVTKPDGGVHKYDNVFIPQQGQVSGTPPFSNNNANLTGSGFDLHQKERDRLSRDRDNSKKGSSKRKDKDKKKDRKSKEDKKGSEKRSSEKIERTDKDGKDHEKDRRKARSNGSMDKIDVASGVPLGPPPSLPPGLPGLPHAVPPGPKPLASATPTEFTALALPSIPIKVDELDSYLREAQKTGEIRMQHKAIPKSMGYTTEDSERPEQREKNRYKNIVPYDYNRAKLDLLPNDPNSHYINASLIDDFHQKKQYIAAQGPIEHTIKDFWRMIWEHNISVLVMVTNPWENGMKCLIYWPEGNDSSLKLGDIEIFLEKKDVSVLPDYTIRKLTAKKGNVQRQIIQLQFRSWRDHGVPRYAMALLNFRDKVRSEIQNVTSPVLIHCSAGVGRTGTFLAIDQLLDQAKDEGVIDVPDCVCRLRKQRSDLVQTEEQYGFIYQAVLEYLVLGQTTIPCYKFEEIYSELKSEEKKNGMTRLKQQYQMLDQFMAERSVNTNLIALEEENRSKNRSSKIIPTDEVRRVKLLSHLEGHSNYINAVFADGHRRAGSFITTEAPIPTTVTDYWRMIHEYQCSIIIMLVPVNDLQKEDLYFPLAPGETLQFTPFEIECIEKKDSQGIEVRKLRMTDKKEKKEIYHMTLSSELEANAEEDLEKMLALYDKMVRRQQSHKDPASGHHARPVVAHCLNGVQWTGLFIVLCHLFDQINNDQEVDIFNAVRQSRLARSQFIGTEEQYVLLHDTVKLYIDSFETYSNFK